MELTLEELKKEYYELRVKLSLNIAAQNKIERQNLLDYYLKERGVTIGDEVELNLERALVVEADENFLYAKKYKKNGELYKTTTRVWKLDRIQKLCS